MLKNIFLTLPLFLSATANAKSNLRDGFKVRCEAVIGDNPDKLVITQDFDDLERPVGTPHVTLFTFRDGRQISINLNPDFPLFQRYVKVDKQSAKPLVVMLDVVNDGKEIIGRVEYVDGNENNLIEGISYSDGKVSHMATGSAVECSVEPLKP